MKYYSVLLTDEEAKIEYYYFFRGHKVPIGITIDKQLVKIGKNQYFPEEGKSTRMAIKSPYDNKSIRYWLINIIFNNIISKKSNILMAK